MVPKAKPLCSQDLRRNCVQNPCLHSNTSHQRPKTLKYSFLVWMSTWGSNWRRRRPCPNNSHKLVRPRDHHAHEPNILFGRSRHFDKAWTHCLYTKMTLIPTRCLWNPLWCPASFLHSLAHTAATKWKMLHIGATTSRYQSQLGRLCKVLWIFTDFDSGCGNKSSATFPWIRLAKSVSRMHLIFVWCPFTAKHSSSYYRPRLTSGALVVG